ncbi:MAG: hypothetical protein ACRDTU_11380, partial [Micromonosporaceae bacterium]
MSAELPLNPDPGGAEPSLKVRAGRWSYLGSVTEGHAMEFCILGTLELRDADRSLPLGAPMQRMLLAHLLLAGGRPVAA